MVEWQAEACKDLIVAAEAGGVDVETFFMMSDGAWAYSMFSVIPSRQASLYG